MTIRGSLLLAFLGPVFVALLAFPVGAATSAGTTSHYPGQKCDKCHKVQGRSSDKAPATPGPAGGAATGTEAGGSQTGTTAPKGAPAAK